MRAYVALDCWLCTPWNISTSPGRCSFGASYVHVSAKHVEMSSLIWFNRDHHVQIILLPFFFFCGVGKPSQLFTTAPHRHRSIKLLFFYADKNATERDQHGSSSARATNKLARNTQYVGQQKTRGRASLCLPSPTLPKIHHPLCCLLVTLLVHSQRNRKSTDRGATVAKRAKMSEKKPCKPHTTSVWSKAHPYRLNEALNHTCRR